MTPLVCTLETQYKNAPNHPRKCLGLVQLFSFVFQRRFCNISLPISNTNKLVHRRESAGINMLTGKGALDVAFLGDEGGSCCCRPLEGFLLGG